MNYEPTVLDLFSGIGGFSLAFESEGFTTVGFAEIEPYACRVLKRHWPTTPNYGDVRTVPAIRCDVVTGGFPCQPFSCAGKRRGKKDDRYLWPAMLDVIKRCRPAWVIGENVPGFIGLALDEVLVGLESEGFECQSFTIPACAVEAPHERNRLWVVACHQGNRNEGWRTESRQFAVTVSGLDINASDLHVSRLEIGEIESAREECQTTVRSDWPISPEADFSLLREVHGLPIGLDRNRKHRIKALGNTIVPQVAQVFAKAIKAISYT